MLARLRADSRPAARGGRTVRRPAAAVERRSVRRGRRRPAQTHGRVAGRAATGSSPGGSGRKPGRRVARHAGQRTAAGAPPSRTDGHPRREQSRGQAGTPPRTGRSTALGRTATRKPRPCAAVAAVLSVATRSPASGTSRVGGWPVGGTDRRPERSSSGRVRARRPPSRPRHRRRPPGRARHRGCRRTPRLSRGRSRGRTIGSRSRGRRARPPSPIGSRGIPGPPCPPRPSCGDRAACAPSRRVRDRAACRGCRPARPGAGRTAPPSSAGRGQRGHTQHHQHRQQHGGRRQPEHRPRTRPHAVHRDIRGRCSAGHSRLDHRKLIMRSIRMNRTGMVKRARAHDQQRDQRTPDRNAAARRWFDSAARAALPSRLCPASS